ncbi:acyltransferase [Nocardioides sp. CGMCC 1.13656]|nr:MULTISPECIES: acyltransferase [unclassified Nocardioides]MBA2954217.1 acyltransferase [Nocardioides sp. CGMCC 1.13656]
MTEAALRGVHGADPAPAPVTAPRRITSLDGLRGLAALTVVVYHITLTDPVIGQRLYQVDQVSGTGWFGYLMTFTPLHVVWAGSQAVLVFFVLSGFVLALPFARRRGTRKEGTWPAFYRSRMVRLYLPSIVSLVLAFLLAQAIRYHADPGLTPWINEHAGNDGPADVAVGSSLMTGFGSLNGSLWSLRWEVLFSLTLPLFLAVAAWRVRLSWLKAGLVLLACVLWPIVTGGLYDHATYMLIFAFGVLMAYEHDRLGVLAERISGLGWSVIVSAACVLLTLQWILMPFGVLPGSTFERAWMSYNTVGAVLLVFAGIFCPQVRRLLERKPIHALGLVSFSLYLVQEPVVLRFSLATDAGLPLWLAIPVELALALAVAFVFYRVVERPAHRLARRASGRTASARPVPETSGAAGAAA